MFNHARLRIRAIQDRNFTARLAFGNQAFRFFDQPLRFLQVTARFVNPYRFAMAGIGTQILAQPFAVMRNQLVGRIQDMAVRAIILLELDQVLHIEFTLERGHVTDVRAAERINALVVIADGEHGALVTGHQFQPFVLQVIRILELVDEDMAEAALVMLAQRLVTAHQFIRAQ